MGFANLTAAFLVFLVYSIIPAVVILVVLGILLLLKITLPPLVAVAQIWALITVGCILLRN